MNCDKHAYYGSDECPRCKDDQNLFAKGREPRKLASVTTLHASNYRDIPATLRNIADAIEAGSFGHVNDVVLVSQGERLEVFNAGVSDVTNAYLLLACGQRKIENAVLRGAGEIL